MRGVLMGCPQLHPLRRVLGLRQSGWLMGWRGSTHGRRCADRPRGRANAVCIAVAARPCDVHAHYLAAYYTAHQIKLLKDGCEGHSILSVPIVTPVNEF